LSTAAKPKESPTTAKEVFEKYYVLAALKKRSPLVTVDDMLELADNEKDQDAIMEFGGTDEYSDNWVVYPDYSEGYDLVAVPSLTKKLREQGLDRVIGWLWYEYDDWDMMTNLASDATLSCTVANGFVEDILELARKYFRVEEDWSGFKRWNYTGAIVYRVYDGDKHVGTIVKEIGYCNDCYWSALEKTDPSSKGGFIQKCEEWFIGEPSKEEEE
jgi:hypothetical protein